MTTILIKKKDTAGAPAPGDLTNAAGGTEIAVNTATKRIYTKDSGGNVVELGTNATSSTIDQLTVVTSATLSYGTANQVQYLNGSKILTGSANMTFNGTTFTLANDTLVNGITVGRGAGAVATNTAVGASALAAETGAGYSLAVGYQSLLNQNVTTGTSGNTAVGPLSLTLLTTGIQNTAIGGTSLAAITTGSYNTAVGRLVMQTSTANSTMNVAIGYNTLNGSGESNYNVAVGGRAMRSNSTGTLNTAVGSGSSISTNGALGNNTTGSYNVAFGAESLYSNTTASSNTAVGYQAGYTNSTGAGNTFLGYFSGQAATTGSYNTALGMYSANSALTGTVNTFVGYASGSAITSGSKNTILGSYNGNQGGLDIRTASNNIVLSDGDGNPRLQVESTGNIQSLGACYRSQTLYTGSGVTGTSSTLDLPDRAMGYIQVFGIGAATERMTMYAFTTCGPSSIQAAITQVQTCGFNLTFTIATVNNYGGFTVSWSGSNSASITVTATYIGLNF